MLPRGRATFPASPMPAIALAVGDLRNALAFAAIAALVALVSPRERKAVGVFSGVLLASLALRALAPLLPTMALPALGSVAGFLGLLLEGVAVVGLASIVLFDVLFRAVRVVVPRLLKELVGALATLGYALVLFSRFHVDVAGIVATSAVITAILGFSLQDTLTNVMGGLSIQIDRSIRIGDWVRVGGASGRVRELSWRHTAIETRDGDTVLLPNALLARSEVVVQGRREPRGDRDRRAVEFFVGDQTPPHDVFGAVLSALRRQPVPNVASDPAPEVLLGAYESSWVRYLVRYWLTDFQADVATDSLVRTRVYYALERAGIPFSIPSQNVLLGRLDPNWTAPKKAHDPGLKREAVEAAPIFRSLTEDERGTLARGLVFAPFAPGEAILVQGDAGDDLFLLASGSVEVRLSLDDGAARPVATLAAPSILGEMGLLTGEPRRASVLAASDVECWRLRKGDFESLVRSRPEIADEVSRVVAAREVELAAAREGLGEEARRRRVQEESGVLRLRIRQFFGLA